LIVLGGVVGIAIAVGIQNHKDQVLSAHISQTEAELRATGGRIAQIKDHEFKSTADYVAAYARIEPLLHEYDQTLQRYNELYETAQRRDRHRGLFNVRRFYSRYNRDVWRNTREVLDLVRQINETIKKEASVIRDMGALPQGEQVQFWHEEFLPLLAQEHALREQLVVAGQRASSNSALQ
jgi:hypothetical protein